jgi:hypothetical protein
MKKLKHNATGVEFEFKGFRKYGSLTLVQLFNLKSNSLEQFNSETYLKFFTEIN